MLGQHDASEEGPNSGDDGITAEVASLRNQMKVEFLIAETRIDNVGRSTQAGTPRFLRCHRLTQGLCSLADTRLVSVRPVGISSCRKKQRRLEGPQE